MNRRHFLLSSAAAAGAAWSAPKSANDTVRIGCVGLRGRGKSHLHAFTTLPNVDLVAVCDVDESVLNAAAKDVDEACASPCAHAEPQLTVAQSGKKSFTALPR